MRVLLGLALLAAGVTASPGASRHDGMAKTIRRLQQEGNQTFAVLVAGSNTYSNYRHQADVCHAYQLLAAHGVPDENIVVMMYDDIAYSPENPKKGKVINHPDGDDVYGGVPRDYVGRDVTADNFLRILRGEAMDGVGSGKALRSGYADNVFVYYADHGASGLVAMPSGGYLYATDLVQALQDMRDKGRFRQLVFYLESCESGSMFLDLKPDLGVYATSASSPYESSYACYFEPTLGTYIGDCYSVAWLEDSDAADLSDETLEQQYLRVRDETTESQVMQWGELDFDNEALDTFQAEEEQQVQTTSRRGLRRRDAPSVQSPGRTSERVVDRKSPLDARDVRLKYLSHKVAWSGSQSDFNYWADQLSQEVRSRDRADAVFGSLARQMDGLQPDSSQGGVGPDCLRRVVEGTEQACGKFTDYSLKYVRHLHDACLRSIPPNTTLEVVQTICAN